MLGRSTFFKVLLTEPSGIVQVSETTQLQVINLHYSTAKNILSETLSFSRFRLLKELEKDCTADYSRFRVPDLIEHENEGEVLSEAKKKAKTINEPIKVFVDLWEKRDKIVTLEWANVTPDSTVEYIYNARKFKRAPTEESQKMQTIDLIIRSLYDFQKCASDLLNKLAGQIEVLDEKLNLKNE